MCTFLNRPTAISFQLILYFFMAGATDAFKFLGGIFSPPQSVPGVKLFT